MDALVEAALRKWPQVPHCWGWLALDTRGDWYLRDAEAQSRGPFPQVKGSRIEHERLRDFIGRNYDHDAHGAWFFQNGPQRVYVELEAAPYVWRIADAPGWPLTSHSGRPATVVHATWLDEMGRLFVETERGFGLVHTLDMALAAQAVDAGYWVPQAMAFDEMPARFSYALRPLRAESPPTAG